MRVMISIVLLVCAVAVADDAPVVGLPLTGEEAVTFLRSAEAVGKPEKFDEVAITEPFRVTLTDGERTLRAIFKDENESYSAFRFGDGTEVLGVKDSFKHEIAAYELDVLLGLGIVPPCVQRTLFRRTGALCMWVEEAMDEARRRERGLRPPDQDRWDDQMATVELFQRLINDLDEANIRNLLSDSNFKIYKVDSSMGFHPRGKLRDEDQLTRFSRQFLEALEALDRAVMDERLGPWINKRERKTLWARRDRILELAAERVAERGEEAVLY
jgi:hypothetical protein